MATYRTVNPATGQVEADFGLWDDAQAEAVLAKAHETFLDWRLVPLDTKQELFRKVADLIEAHTDEIADLITREMGMLRTFSPSQPAMAAQMFRYYAENAPRLLADQEIAIPGFSKAWVAKEPTGVTLGIEPWNAPTYQAMRVAAPNLMLGNTVVVKPARICAGSTLPLDNLFLEAGFPEGCYRTALIDTDQTSRWIADPRVRAVTLTGSDTAGAAVAAQAGKALKPCVLELGGSDAAVVLDSADIAKAVATIASCRLMLGGQACALPKRSIVTERVFDQYAKEYTEFFAGQKIGDPMDPETNIGPMSSAEAVEGLQALLDDAVAKGATVLLDGGKVDGHGFFFKPVVLTDITPEMRIYHEEAFGPFGLLFKVPDADAAIALGNDTKYGLGGVVFGEDLDEARRVARLLDTGAVGINSFVGAPIEAPFGGTKASGFGRELGPTGMDQFANVKTYTLP